MEMRIDNRIKRQSSKRYKLAAMLWEVVRHEGMKLLHGTRKIMRGNHEIVKWDNKNYEMKL